LESVNVDDEFVRDLKDRQSWLNVYGENNIHQYSVVTRPDGSLFRIGNKFSKTKKIFWEIQEKIRNNNATDLQKKEFNYINEHLPSSAHWKQVKRQRKGEAPKKNLDNASRIPQMMTTLKRNQDPLEAQKTSKRNERQVENQKSR
jgi:hypothetical protein